MINLSNSKYKYHNHDTYNTKTYNKKITTIYLKLWKFIYTYISMQKNIEKSFASMDTMLFIIY